MNLAANIFIQAVLVLISLLLVLKDFEIIWHMRKRYRNKDLKKYNEKEWPVIAMLGRFVRPDFFRFRYFIMFMVILLPFSRPGVVSIVSAVILYLSILIQLIRIILDQFRFGSGKYLKGILPYPEFFPDSVFTGKTTIDRFRTFFKLFSGLCLIVVMGYATMYYELYKWMGVNSFTGIPSNGQEYFHFIYLSVLTFATAVYGDILPAANLIPRFLVMSEIIEAFLILIAFIVSVSLTFQMDKGKR